MNTRFNQSYFEVDDKSFHLKGEKADRLGQIKEEMEQSFKKYLKVKKKLNDPDIVTSEVKKDLDGRTPSHFGKEKGYISTYRYPIRFFVTPKNSSRALRILDTFVKLVRARNHKISLNGWTYEIIIGDERYEFGIREKQVRTESTTKGYAYDYKATGLLVLSTGRFWQKKENIDGKIPLEKQLSTIVAELEYQTELWQAEMRKHRAEQAIDDEKKRIIQEETKIKEKEREDFKALLKQAKMWHKANILREYIEIFEENCLKNNTLSEETKEWLYWAKAKAEWYDPLVEKADGNLRDVDKNDL